MRRAAAAAAALILGAGLLVMLLVAGQDTPTGADCNTTTMVTGPVAPGVDTAARAAAAAGWTGEDLVVAVAVAGAESGYDPKAANSTSTARGMWQIMMSFHEPKFAGADWSDPYANARVAHIIWSDSGWSPWVAHTSGAYQAHMDEARTAVAALTTTARTVAHTTTDARATTGPGPDGVKPIARAAADFIRTKFGFTGTILGYGTRGNDTKHDDGLAIDVMLDADNPTERALGDQVAAYFAGPGRDSFHVDNIIWRQRITNAGRGWVWGPMEDRGSKTANHLDHVHLDFHDAAPTTGVGFVPDPACDTTQVPVAVGSVVWPADPDTDRRNYGQGGSMWSHNHTGTDFSVPCGTPVKAAHGGTVSIDTTQAWSGPWLVKVSTRPSSLTTWYAHMQSVSVQTGDVVQAGQTIGQVGSEGNSTGCHLHFEVHPRNGSIYEDGINPSTWLQDNAGTGTGTDPTPVVAAGEAYRVATLNMLGHSHTRPGGNKPGWPSSSTRTRRAVAMLTGYGVSVVALQEVEKTQQAQFRRAAPGWGLHAGSHAEAVAWDTRRFALVAAGQVPIPYFHGRIRQMPVVVLQDRTTGKVTAYGSFHNPASVRRVGDQSRWRDEAERRQITLAAAYHRQGVPIMVMGDFNEKWAGVRGFTTAGTLTTPAPAGWRGIDWIFGTTGTPWTGFYADRSLKARGIADHPLVVAQVGR